MEDFTNDQTAGIATEYNNMARALNEYQLLYWPTFSHEQQLDLNAYQNSLLNRARDLQERITRPAFSDGTGMAILIEKAASEARTSLKFIKNPPVALNVGAMVVALAAYVARSNTRGIQTILRELKDLLEREKNKS